MARYRVRPTVDRISRVFIRNVKVQENLQLLQGETLKSNEEIIQKSYNYDMYDDAGTVSPNYPNGGPFAKPKFNGTVWIEGGDAFDVLLNGPTRPSTNDISIEMNVPKTSFNNDFEAEETVLYMEKDNRLVPISPFIGLNNVIGDFEGKMKNTTNLVSSKTNVNGIKQVDLSNLLSDLYVKMNKLDSNVIPDIYRGLLKRNNNDLNTIDSGFYQVPANATNMPTGIENDASNDAFLYVSSSNTKRNQILILTDGRMFSRLGTKSGSNVTYQPWKKILGEDVGGLKKYDGDLNNVKEFGMYELGLSITNQPSNTLGTGFLMVFGIKSELFTALNQFIFISGRMFHRSFSDSSWTNWTNMDEIDLADFRDDINLNTENNRKVYFKTTDGQKVSLQEVFQSAVDGKNTIINGMRDNFGVRNLTTNSSWSNISNAIKHKNLIYANIGELYNSTIRSSSKQSGLVTGSIIKKPDKTEGRRRESLDLVTSVFDFIKQRSSAKIPITINQPANTVFQSPGEIGGSFSNKEIFDKLNELHENNDRMDTTSNKILFKLHGWFEGNDSSAGKTIWMLLDSVLNEKEKINTLIFNNRSSPMTTISQMLYGNQKMYTVLCVIGNYRTITIDFLTKDKKSRLDIVNYRSFMDSELLINRNLDYFEDSTRTAMAVPPFKLTHSINNDSNTIYSFFIFNTPLLNTFELSKIANGLTDRGLTRENISLLLDNMTDKYIQLGIDTIRGNGTINTRGFVYSIYGPDIR